MGRPLILASGQLSSTAAALVSGSAARAPVRVDVVLQNTGDSEETVILTVSRNGGTARRLFRLVLQEDEQGLVKGVPVQPEDTIRAVTSTDSAVDYLVAVSGQQTLSVDVLDAAGTSKGVSTLRRMLQALEQLAGETADPG